MLGSFCFCLPTPHSGDNNRFLNLLNILDEAEFPKGGGTQNSIKKIKNQPNVVQKYIYRNDKLGVTDFDKKPLFRDIKSQSVFIEFTDEEKDFSRAVMNYILAYYEAQKEAEGSLSLQIGFVGTIYRKMLASSWRSLYRSILARYSFLESRTPENSVTEALADEEEEVIDEKEEREIEKLIKDMKQKKIYPAEKKDLKTIIEKAELLKKNNIDSKISKLKKILNLPENKESKFLIFTQYVKTLDVIKEALGKKNTAEIQGSINPKNRRGQVEKFRNRVRFMISTEAGGEGINLQFAHKVINFELEPCTVATENWKGMALWADPGCYCLQFLCQRI